MRTNRRHCSHVVDQRLMTSATALVPASAGMRTRQRLLFFVIGILLSGTLVLRRIATTHAREDASGPCVRGDVRSQS
jgi:hypothetical protein